MVLIRHLAAVDASAAVVGNPAALYIHVDLVPGVGALLVQRRGPQRPDYRVLRCQRGHLMTGPNPRHRPRRNPDRLSDLVVTGHRVVVSVAA